MRYIFESSKCVPIVCEECGKELGMCHPTYEGNIFDLCFECFDKFNKKETELFEKWKRGEISYEDKVYGANKL